MQTYTHLAVGTAIGGVLAHIALTDQVVVISATVIGAGLPDVPIACQMMTDLVYYKRAPFSEAHNQPWWFLAKELSHTLPVFGLALVMLVSTTNTDIVSLGFLLGALSHILIDGATHYGKEYAETDQSCLWPINPLFTKRKLSDFIGVAEYRYSAGALWPLKPFELATLVTSIIVAVLTVLL